MNTERIARGWALIAEGAMELSLAYESLDPAVARTAVETGAGGAKAGQPSSAPVAFAADEPPPLKPQVDAGLGVCPIHGVRWSIKAAGVGKNGPYEAFWKCAESDDGVYCKQKPQKIWRDTHPAEAVVAA